MAHRNIPPLRRNGTRPSCEPCRKSKYSCDHRLPPCARCVRRGIPTKCAYHPAPMSGSPHHRTASQHGQSSIHGQRRITQSPEASPSDSALNAQRMLHRGPGFLGSTSYRAVLTEKLAQASVARLGSICNAETTETTICEQTPGIPLSRVRDALGIFDCLNHFSVLEALVGKWQSYHRCSSMIDFFVEDCVTSVKVDLLENQSLTTDDARKSTMNRIFHNTFRPILISKSLKMSEYIRLFTGAALRWEALAVFFVACGLCCHSTRSSDAELFKAPDSGQMNKSTLMKELLSASTTCISFCEDMGNFSDLGLWAYHGVNTLSSKVLGDSHPLVWRQGNDVSMHLVSQGLHSESDRTLSQLPFWLIEMRRRAVANIYWTDKLLSTFFGRPPRLSQRYCTIHVPLDLELSELALNEADLEEKLSSIGVDGWNQKYSERSACLRCFVLSSRLREEILELSLGPASDQLINTAKRIIAENTVMMQGLPSKLQHTANLWHEIESQHAVMTAHVHLDFLYNEFMLRRLLYNRYRENRSEMLSLALRMLTVVLEASSIRACQCPNADHIPWIVVLYGLPSAGLLAVELLRHKGQGEPNATPSPVPDAGRPLPVTLRQSETFSWTKVLEDLTVFQSVLKWMHFPWEGNYELANEAHQSLQRVLSKVMSVNEATSDDYIQHSGICNGHDGSATASGSNESNAMSLQQTGAQNGTPFSSFQEMAADDLDWDVTAGFDIDFWMDLPDGVQI